MRREGISTERGVGRVLYRRPQDVGAGLPSDSDRPEPAESSASRDARTLRSGSRTAALAAVDGDEILRLEQPEGLTRDREADAEPCCQDFLPREPFARREGAGQNLLAHLGGNDVSEPCLAQSPGLCRFGGGRLIRDHGSATSIGPA